MTNEAGTIEPGQPIPQATVQIKTEDGIDARETCEYFASGRTVMFALPGAFTSTCSAKHLPEFVDRADDLKAAGIDRIACLAVNDAPWTRRQYGGYPWRARHTLRHDHR